MCRMPEHVFNYLGNGFRLESDRPKRTRNRADAAFQRRIFRQEANQNVSQSICIGEPLGSAPIRLINVFLDPRAVKRSVGKPIDRKNVEAVVLEKIGEALKLSGI